ncbi:MAG: hypothetical protein QXW00_02590 [Candidatus Woesearchaeota archaeon]
MTLTRKGVEFSVSYLVGLILAIAVFAGGMFILRGIRKTNEDILANYADEYSQKMQELACPSQDYVCVDTVQKETTVGRAVGYTLRILNAKDTDSDFYVNIELKSSPSGADATKIIFIPKNSEAFRIQSGEATQIPIIILPKPGAKQGTYSFRLQVKDSDGNNYGPVKLLYLIVK